MRRRHPPHPIHDDSPLALALLPGERTQAKLVKGNFRPHRQAHRAVDKALGVRVGVLHIRFVRQRVLHCGTIGLWSHFPKISDSVSDALVIDLATGCERSREPFVIRLVLVAVLVLRGRFLAGFVSSGHGELLPQDFYN